MQTNYVFYKQDMLLMNIQYVASFKNVDTEFLSDISWQFVFWNIDLDVNQRAFVAWKELWILVSPDRVPATSVQHVNVVFHWVK